METQTNKTLVIGHYYNIKALLQHYIATSHIPKTFYKNILQHIATSKYYTTVYYKNILQYSSLLKHLTINLLLYYIITYYKKIYYNILHQ